MIKLKLDITVRPLNCEIDRAQRDAILHEEKFLDKQDWIPKSWKENFESTALLIKANLLTLISCHNNSKMLQVSSDLALKVEQNIIILSFPFLCKLVARPMFTEIWIRSQSAECSIFSQ